MVAGSGRCTFSGGRSLPTWTRCGPGPSSAWVSKGNSPIAGEVGHGDGNICLRVLFVYYLSGTQFKGYAA